MIGMLLVVLAPIVSSAQSAPPSDRLPAIWRTHQVDFNFRSERLAFRCEEFAWRLSRILGSVGAQLDSRTQLVCDESFARAIKGRVVVSAPVEATDANVQRALAEVSAVDQLAARLNRRPDPKSRIHVFPAEWRQVSSVQPKLDAADCDLVRAVARQVFPALKLQDLDVSTTCVSRRAPRFSATALIRVDGVYIDKQDPELEAELEAIPAG
jgi:hypothetical protein